MIHLPSMNKSKTSSATFCHPSPPGRSTGAQDDRTLPTRFWTCSLTASGSSLTTSEDDSRPNRDEATKGEGSENRDEDGQGYGNRIHDEARLGSDAEDSFAEPDREEKTDGRAKQTTGKTEERGFDEEEAEDAAGGTADGFHEGDIVFALHGDVGHCGHDAKSGEDEDDGDGGVEDAGNAVVDSGFAFGELADGADIEIGKLLLQRGDVVLDLLRSARNAELDEADAARRLAKDWAVFRPTMT